jgi:hypothetical protein
VDWLTGELKIKKIIGPKGWKSKKNRAKIKTNLVEQLIYFLK